MPDSPSPWTIVPLPLDVGGKKYEVQPAPYETGLSILEGVTKGDEDTRPPQEVFAEMMGDTWDQMRDDKVPYHIMFRAGLAALTFQTALVVVGLSSDEAVKRALAVWNEAPTPESVAAALMETAAEERPKPARKRPAKKAAPRSATSSTSSNSSASAGGTPRRASSSPTTSRKSTRQPKS